MIKNGKYVDCKTIIPMSAEKTTLEAVVADIMASFYYANTKKVS